MGSLRWPLFDLRVVTPGVELRFVDDDLLEALTALAIDGVHAPDAMPFNVPWTRQPPDVMRVEYPRHIWLRRSSFCPADWSLQLAVLVDGEVAGVQDLFAKSFAVTRQFETGSWLGLRYQGRGIGTEMRAAVLHLGFAGLGATRALSGAFADNPASAAVSRKLGYLDNGWAIADREGRAARLHHFALDREDWERRRRDDIAIEGLGPCLPLLGLDS